MQVLTTNEPHLHNLISVHSSGNIRSSSVDVTLTRQAVPFCKSHIVLFDTHQLFSGLNFLSHFATSWDPLLLSLVTSSSSLSPHIVIVRHSFTVSFLSFQAKTYLFHPANPSHYRLPHTLLWFRGFYGYFSDLFNLWVFVLFSHFNLRYWPGGCRDNDRWNSGTSRSPSSLRASGTAPAVAIMLSDCGWYQSRVAYCLI